MGEFSTHLSPGAGNWARPRAGSARGRCWAAPPHSRPPRCEGGGKPGWDKVFVRPARGSRACGNFKLNCGQEMLAPCAGGCRAPRAPAAPAAAAAGSRTRLASRWVDGCPHLRRLGRPPDSGAAAAGNFFSLRLSRSIIMLALRLCRLHPVVVFQQMFCGLASPLLWALPILPTLCTSSQTTSFLFCRPLRRRSPTPPCFAADRARRGRAAPRLARRAAAAAVGAGRARGQLGDAPR